MTLKLSMMRAAVISDDGVYRYELTRRWAPGPVICWIGLNPSTADAEIDDQTIRRVVRYSRVWGYGKAVMVNLFAFRTKSPAIMRSAPDPVGPENDRYLLSAASESAMVMAAWGTHGWRHGRDVAVCDLLRTHELHCLGTTQEGFPCHPSRLANELLPVPFPRRS